MLLDSNAIIYLGGSVYRQEVAACIADMLLYTCNTIIVEVLGYEHLSEDQERGFSRPLMAYTNLPFDDEVTKRAIAIRRSVKIQLPDAIIAATALVHDLILVTSNVKDFKRVSGLRLLDPLIA